LVIETCELPDRVVVAVRHIGPYDQVGAGFATLDVWLREHPEVGPLGEMLAISYDDPSVTPAAQLRSDAAVEVLRPGSAAQVVNTLAGPAPVVIRTVPGGRFATARHRGPYRDLPTAWEGFLAGLAAAGTTADPRRPSFEVYRNTPADTADSDLLTDLFAAIT
jgi:AraC family transcriptional regulator